MIAAHAQKTQIPLLVLNYNGRALLAECLPSILRAAAASRHDCRAWVIDNSSTDDSVDWLAKHAPQVSVIRQPNRGLCSFNDVLAEWDCAAAVLLNNDVKLDEHCIDPLVQPLMSPSCHQRPCFLTAPLCWQFDGQTCEGLKTAVQWRFGLVQATGRFPGHEKVRHIAGLTASAGAVLAVDRQKFIELGGFDPLYLPGRIEDLDFAFRGYLAGYRAEYVPAAVAYHKGLGSFGPAFTPAGCDHLALRNTLLFQWKNVRHPWHVARQLAGLPLRVMRDVVQAPFVAGDCRFAFVKALSSAIVRVRRMRPAAYTREALARERQFFREFHPGALRAARVGRLSGAVVVQDGPGDPSYSGEAILDQRHPLSRWYLLAWADRWAVGLSSTAIRPWQVTLLGFAVACAAGACICYGYFVAAATLVLAAWFCDRLDGKLARRQETATHRGAWLDANLDELTDLGLHAALACAAATATGSLFCWGLFAAFVIGKYLFMHGLMTDPLASVPRTAPTQCKLVSAHQRRWLRELYHLPGNADVRMHVLVICLAGGWLTAELAFVAVYFNLRWLARYVLVMTRFASRTLNPEP